MQVISTAGLDNVHKAGQQVYNGVAESEIVKDSVEVSNLTLGALEAIGKHTMKLLTNTNYESGVNQSQQPTPPKEEKQEIEKIPSVSPTASTEIKVIPTDNFQTIFHALEHLSTECSKRSQGLQKKIPIAQLQILNTRVQKIQALYEEEDSVDQENVSAGNVHMKSEEYRKNFNVLLKNCSDKLEELTEKFNEAIKNTPESTSLISHCISMANEYLDKIKEEWLQFSGKITSAAAFQILQITESYFNERQVGEEKIMQYAIDLYIVTKELSTEISKLSTSFVEGLRSVCKIARQHIESAPKETETSIKELESKALSNANQVIIEAGGSISNLQEASRLTVPLYGLLFSENFAVLEPIIEA